MWLWWLLACAKTGSGPAGSAEPASFQEDAAAFGAEVMMFESRQGQTRVIQPCGPLPALAPRPDATYRLAACTGTEGHVAMPLEGAHVAAIRPYLREGAVIDVLATIEAAEGPKTITVMAGRTLDERGWALLDPAMAETYAHAAARGTVGFSLQRSPGATEDPSQLDTLIPAGMRAVFAALPRGVSPTPFLRPGDIVDVLTAQPDSAAPLLQAVYCVRADRMGSGRDRLGLVVTSEQAEAFLHAIQTSTVRIAMRNPGDTAEIDPGEPLTDPEWPILADARVPIRLDGPAGPRIRPGMRGFMVEAEEATEGGTVEVVGDAKRVSEELVLTGTVTAAIAKRSEGNQVVLLHTWPEDAVALTLAAARHAPLLARPE